LSGRLVKNLEADASAGCDYYWLYSKSRGAKPLKTTAKHLNLKSAIRHKDDAVYQELLASLQDDNKITVVSHRSFCTPGDEECRYN
jgi:hypothetical protein